MCWAFRKAFIRQISKRLLVCTVYASLSVTPIAAQNWYTPGSTTDSLYHVWDGRAEFLYYPCFLVISSNAWGVSSNAHTRSGSYHPTPRPSSAFTVTSNGPWFHELRTDLNAPQMSVWLKAGERSNYPQAATDIRRMISDGEYLQACAQVCSSYSSMSDGQIFIGYSRTARVLDSYWPASGTREFKCGKSLDDGNAGSRTLEFNGQFFSGLRPGPTLGE